MKQKFWFCRMFDGSLRLTETEAEMRQMPRPFYAEEPQIVEIDVKDMVPATVVTPLPDNLIVMKATKEPGLKGAVTGGKLSTEPEGPKAA